MPAVVSLLSSDDEGISAVAKGPAKNSQVSPVVQRSRITGPSVKYNDLLHDEAWDDMLLESPVRKRRRLSDENAPRSQSPDLDRHPDIERSEVMNTILPSNRLQNQPVALSSTARLPTAAAFPFLELSSPLKPVEAEFVEIESSPVRHDVLDLVSSLSDDPSPDLNQSHAPPKSYGLSKRTMQLLQELNGNTTRKPKARPPSAIPADDGDEDDDLPGDLSQQSAPAARRARKTGVKPGLPRRATVEGSTLNSDPKEGERRASNSQAAQQAREEKKRAQAARKAEKQQEKDRKVQEKQAAAELAEANKGRWDKKASTAEMILDLPASMSDDALRPAILAQLQEHPVEVSTHAGVVPDIVKWRRRITSTFNEEQGHWQPCAERLKREAHILSVVSGERFVAMATSDDEDEGLRSFVRMIQQHYARCKLLLLIQGLETFLRKKKNASNRAYVASVRRGEDTNTGTTPSAMAAIADLSEQIEDALVDLQIEHKCLVHQTANASETAEWIASFTVNISTIPYREQQMGLDTGFCMDVGQVRTGKDDQDTFVKMLQQIVRVTEPVAQGIAKSVHDLAGLMAAFRANGPRALEDIKKMTNRDGGITDARIGPAISQRLYQIFTSTDPGAVDL